MKKTANYDYDPTLGDNRVYTRHEKCRVCASYERCLTITAQKKKNETKFPCELSGDFSSFVLKEDLPRTQNGDHGLDLGVFVLTRP